MKKYKRSIVFMLSCAMTLSAAIPVFAAADSGHIDLSSSNVADDALRADSYGIYYKWEYLYTKTTENGGSAAVYDFTAKYDAGRFNGNYETLIAPSDVYIESVSASMKNPNGTYTYAAVEGFKQKQLTNFKLIFYKNGTYTCKITSSSGYSYSLELVITNASDGDVYDSADTNIFYGDANCDGRITIADSTAILQHLGNEDKYGLSEQGKKNADVDGKKGVTGNDAITIQMVDAKMLTAEALPLK